MSTPPPPPRQWASFSPVSRHVWFYYNQFYWIKNHSTWWINKTTMTMNLKAISQIPRPTELTHEHHGYVIYHGRFCTFIWFYCFMEYWRLAHRKSRDACSMSWRHRAPVAPLVDSDRGCVPASLTSWMNSATERRWWKFYLRLTQTGTRSCGGPVTQSRKLGHGQSKVLNLIYDINNVF